MRFLHTADWHVGKKIRGRSRADEHVAVLSEMAELARANEVDAVLIAGDLFDTAAPTAQSESIVYRALLDFVDAGAKVVLIAGNHDSPDRLRAIQPLLELAQVHVLSAISRPDEGGAMVLAGRSGEKAHIALLPFVSQRDIVKADTLMSEEGMEHSQAYAERLSRVIDHLCRPIDGAQIQLAVAHAMVHGARLGGGERSAHTVFDYSIPATCFPAHLHAVALGHLHRRQKIAGACPIHYCGSPLQLDFAERQDDKSVDLITAEPGRPAKIEPLPITGGKRLTRVSGTLGAIAAATEGLEEHFLSIELDEPPRPGLADDVRERVGSHVIEVRVKSTEAVAETPASIEGRSVSELFASYLDEQPDGDSDRVLGLFKDLLEETYASDSP